MGLATTTVEAFNTHMRSAEARFDRDVRSGRFLWVDGSPARRDQVKKGKVLAEPSAGKGDIPVAGGLIHDWVGAVFIPGVGMEKTLALVEDYSNHKNIYRPEVVDSKLLHHQDGDYRIYLRLLKKQFANTLRATRHALAPGINR